MRWFHAFGCLSLITAAVHLTSLTALHETRLYAQATNSEIDEELARQRQIVERFVGVLERNPRRGTALDRIYGFHIENGTIEKFVKELRERVNAQPADGKGWMILGIVEAQRGRDSAAVEALAKAQELRPLDPLAAYYLGQCLVLIGQPEKAVAAFEEAIARKPAQVDLLEIFQALGRVHQRAQRSDEALAVWSRLEKLFPSDLRVQEQIALTLAEEGQLAQALPRYEALAQKATDDYRRTMFRVEVADLKVKLNRASDGIADLEQLIAKLNPESWLFREVRRKIEEVFLRTDDQNGLAKYYGNWIAKNGDDVEAMARLARVLARQARVPEAQEWLEKALKLAPSRKDLRLAFIDQLVDDRRYAEAGQQYAALDKFDPNNPDYLRDWGKVLLRDTDRPQEERQQAAEKIWRRLVAARPTDPLIVTQVADLFRHAEMHEAALELYQQAVTIAPHSPQYREYLGEFYHILKRPDEAVATWKNMAAGDQRTASNVSRLAEVYAQFGYLKEALLEIAAACELDPKDFALQLKAAELQIRGETYPAALASLSRAQKLAQNDEEHEAVLNQQIKIHVLENKLADLAAQLTAQTKTAVATFDDWFLLARYRENLHEYPEATAAINEALQRQPNHLRSLASAARIAEQAGDLKTAADLNRKLAVVDRRGKSEYLQHVSALETQLGRIDEALAAGRELIAASPGNVETYQFFADLCFRLNRPDEGLTALRRATRVNPNEPSLLISLASALAGQFRTDEAIELYWQAFEKHTQLDDKLGDVSKLTDLYLQANHFDQLLERLERNRREADQRREMTICLAQAYQSAGDFGMARQELERLLSENVRDTQLLLQLSKLAEAESDFVNAAKYQEQLAKLAPGPESDYRLANLLSRAGNIQESAAIVVRLAAKEENKEKLLRGIDGLLTNGDPETALPILAQKLRENPTDWELLYRQAVAMAKLTPAAATPRFQALLDLTVNDDDLSTAAKSEQKKPKTKQISSRAVVRRDTSRLDAIWEIRRAVGLDQQSFYNTQSRPAIWMPRDFGQSRLAALGWIVHLEQDSAQADAFVQARREQAEKPAATTRELWDFVYLQHVRADEQELRPFTRRLAESGGRPEKILYLSSLAGRVNAEEAEDSDEGLAAKDKTPPLPAEELEFALKIWQAVRGSAPQGGESESNGGADWTIGTILHELTRAGRKDEADQLYAETIKRATTSDQLISALQLASTRDDRQQAFALFDQLAAKDLQTQAANPAASSGDIHNAGVNALTEIIGNEKTPTADVLAALDCYLAARAAKVNQARSSLTYRPSRTNNQPGSTYLQIHIGKSYRGVQISYPAPNEYFDQQGLQLLRTALEVYRAQDLTSDLIQHALNRGEAAPQTQRLFDLLAAAYLQVWSDDREAAVGTLAQATALVPQDTALRQEVARLQLEMGQLDEALAIAESISPLDQRSMQQRETLALDLAVRLGDHQRAREAAQRLFGLRLDADSQIALAGQMRRLGMNEEAEAILARAQRQAGSKLSALTALMGQHQAQGKLDLAAQVAQQILRRSRSASASQVAMGYSTSDSQSRSAALACLAQAGKLKELIAGIEEQIQRSPSATQLYETLSEYYQAAGDAQKMLDLQAKVVSLRPDDGDLRFRYGQELYRRGKVNEACEEFLVVIKKQPRLIGQRYYEVSNAFQRARREADLAKALTEINLKSIGQPYMVSNLISNMMRNSGRSGNDNGARAAGMLLFKKAWEAFPDQRAELMSNFSGSEMWTQPEVLEYGKKSLVPTVEIAKKQPWYGLSNAGVSSGGHIYSTLQSVLDGATKTNQLPSVRKDIAAAIEEFPNWKVGPMLLAVIDLRLGKEVDMEAALAPLLDRPKSVGRELYYEQWILAQELASKPKHKDLALKLYESAALNSRDDDYNYQYEYSADPPLAKLYQSVGRREDARRVLLKSVRHQPRDNGNYQYNLYRQAESLISIGGQFQDLDFPVDALRTYRELLTNPAYNDPLITNFTGRDPEYYLGRARAGIQAVTKKFVERQAGDVAVALLTPADKARTDAPAVDLMLMATTAGTNALPTLESPLLALIRPAGITAAAALQVEQQLDELAKQFPQDLSVPVAAALFALQSNDNVRASAPLARLIKAVEATPLEPVVGKRANARQRAEATRQIGLWLVARQCMGVPEFRNHVEPLAKRAIAAAQRQLDPAQLVAIQYERGRLALDANDRPAAEQCWNELIDLALIAPRQSAKNAASQPASAVATKATPPKAPPNGKIPTTLSQFKLGAAIAQAAADFDLAPLSLRAIREALSGGVPVADLPKTSADGSVPRVNRTTLATAASSRGDIDQQVFAEMSSRLVQLSAAWKRHSFPPAEICQLLEEIVFPASRPTDVLVYEQPLTSDVTNPQSVGRLLVEWSLRAGRETQLREQIAARQSSPTDVVGGLVLLLQLSLAKQEINHAREHLEAIARQLETSKLNSLVNLAAHAAAAALGNAQLTDISLPLLEKLAATPNPPGQRFVYGQTPSSQSAATVVIREHLKLGNADAARATLERLLQTRQEQHGRIIGDGASYYQRQDLAWAANELSRGGDLTVTLAALARFADVTTSRDRDVPITALGVALWHLDRQARRLPLADRYQILRDWTLPTKDRRSVRVVCGYNSGQPIPSIFLGSSAPADLAYSPLPRVEPVSNVTLLVEAASQSGKLADLLQTVQPLVTDKVPGAEILEVLTLVAQRDDVAATPKLRAIAARWQEAVKQQAANAAANNLNAPARQNLPEVSEYLMARAALDVPKLSVQAKNLAKLYLDIARRKNLREVVTHVSHDLTHAQTSGLLPAEHQQALALPLALWTAGTNPQTADATLPPAQWIVHDGHLFHSTGCENDALFFKQPLEGEFEFSYDTYTASYSLCHLAYGGVEFGAATYNGPQQIASISQHEQVQRPGQLEAQDAWNHVTLRVNPDSIRYFVNGHLVYEDRSPSRTSPWLHLQAQSDRAPAMKNLQLTGKPIVPSEVKLIEGDQLDGWNAGFYNENLPQRLRKTEPATDAASERGPYYGYNAAGDYVLIDPNAPKVIDWQAAAGVLEGRSDPNASPRLRSRLFYHRPLADSDHVAYQFFYEPGRIGVHPTFGRIAFLLEPAGVKLHWMSRQTDANDALLVDPRLTVEEPTSRRGPAPLPLKVNDWNAVEVLATGDQLAIRLNGELICERPIEPTSDRRFGFFHFKTESAVKVRNVVLRGNWPQSLAPEQQSDLLATNEPAPSAAVMAARHGIIGERLYATAAYEVWKQSREMAPVDRYEFLQRWVLPSPAHPTLRLQVDWTPADAVASVPSSNANAPRIHTGAELVSPALEMIAVAKELNKLDELATAAAVAGKENADLKRSLAAFNILLALARGDDRAATNGLKQALDFVKTQPAWTPFHERHAEYLACYAGLGNPRTRAAAKTLALEIAKDQQPPRAVNAEWSRRAPYLRALANWAASPAAATTTFGATKSIQWQPVTRATAPERGKGHPAGAWQIRPGEATCLSGSPRSALYFASPLTGDFEVSGQVTTAANRTIRLLYGGFALAVNSDGKLVIRQDVGRAADQRTPLLEKPQKFGATVEYKLVVKDSALTAFVNGQQVYTERLPARLDPWLAIETTTPNQTGTIKNVRIAGAPLIPRELSLSNLSTLDGWIAAYYNETISGTIDPDSSPTARQSAAWTKDGEEITAGQLPNCAGSLHESILQYHRLLLEDGEVEYEFFYEPGKTEVHPALDRLAFLLAPDGVRTHWLTDGQYERTGLAPDNSTPLASSRPVPLQAGQWNLLKLVLRGNQIVIHVNGTEVASRTLESTNQRTLGLFRFADITAVQVRNVNYRGNWPTTLPALAEQELATSSSE
ncbi:MAG TPA: DUF1583 domain-containing protein [Pirellulaceae bacterium]|jgi:tetratricopeptide (TPR) repeat protein